LAGGREPEEDVIAGDGRADDFGLIAWIVTPGALFGTSICRPT